MTTNISKADQILLLLQLVEEKLAKISKILLSNKILLINFAHACKTEINKKLFKIINNY